MSLKLADLDLNQELCDQRSQQDYETNRTFNVNFYFLKHFSPYKSTFQLDSRPFYSDRMVFLLEAFTDLSGRYSKMWKTPDGQKRDKSKL